LSDYMIGASPGKHLSYWIDTTPRTDYPVLPGDVSADVAVLGGGLVGLSAAVLLKRLGKSVVVIEARRIAEGVTGHTTAKRRPNSTPRPTSRPSTVSGPS
jgi:FAD dependent oxidoreductase